MDGGHYNGRKWPIVFAGGLLNDAQMRSPGLEIGNEDQQTYRSPDGVARWGRNCAASHCFFQNGCAYGGTCTSGAKDCRDPAGAVDGCAGYRNCCTSIVWVGEALSATLMGLRESWPHPPFFDYVDRWMSADVAMWQTYRDRDPAPLCTAP